jgi:hypothetical protein
MRIRPVWISTSKPTMWANSAVTSLSQALALRSYSRQCVGGRLQGGAQLRVELRVEFAVRPVRAHALEEIEAKIEIARVVAVEIEESAGLAAHSLRRVSVTRRAGDLRVEAQ